uniref:hypothetical protein n=1 Tax=Agathobacter sp. TaxID=2021311 RepID=UPI00405733EA
MEKDRLLSKEEFLFYAALLLFLLTTMFDLTVCASMDGADVIKKVMQIVRYGTYAICIAVIFQKFIQKSKLIGIIGIVAILGLSLLGSTNKTMFLYAFLIIAAHQFKSERILKVSFFTMSFCWISVILASQIGLIEDYVFEPELRARHGLGFAWTTTGAILYFFIVLQYVCLRKAKLSYLELAVLEGVNIVLYVLTDSRMAFLLLSLFLITICFVKIGRNRWYFAEKLKYLFVFMPSAIACIAVAIHLFYDSGNAFWQKLNNLLSGRLQLGRDAITEYGFSLLGQKIEWVGFSLDNLSGEDYNYVDCAYLQLLLEYGILFLVLIMVLYSILVYKALKSKNYYFMWAIMFILVLSITEPRLMNLAFNPFPVLFLSEVESVEQNRENRKLWLKQNL